LYLVALRAAHPASTSLFPEPLTRDCPRLTFGSTQLTRTRPRRQCKPLVALWVLRIYFSVTRLLKSKESGKAHSTMVNTQKEKTQHDLDDQKLGLYLQQEIPSLKTPVLSTKIGYGQSNPTYYVDDAAGTRYILRKKPSGTIISPVAHQVDREYKVLKALGSVEGFPVPRVYCLCMDASIIGTAFYVRPSHPPDKRFPSNIPTSTPGHGVHPRPYNHRPQPLHPAPLRPSRSMEIRHLNPSMAALHRPRVK